MTEGSEEPPLVFASVGTDHHPFDRLLRWLASWPRATDGSVRVLVQAGATPPHVGLPSQAYLDAAAMDETMAAATVVVCHGGPGTIMQARVAGHLPIVVARRPELGEHIDGHQLRFATWMSGRGHVAVAATEAELHAALDRALDEPGSFRLAPGTAGDAEVVSARFGELVDGVARYRPR